MDDPILPLSPPHSPPHSPPQSKSTTINTVVPQATIANARNVNKLSDMYENNPGIAALARSYRPTRKRIYPFFPLRKKIISYLMCCLPEEPSFDCIVKFAIMNNSQEILIHRFAGGVKDTGLDVTVLSCAYFAKYLEPYGVCVSRHHGGAKTIFRTVDGSEIKSTGTVYMRFLIEGETKFIEALFEVSEVPIEGFEVVIGADIIGKYYRLIPFGCPGTREPQPPSVSQQELAEAARIKQETSAADLVIKKDFKSKQLQNGTATSPSHLATRSLA